MTKKITVLFPVYNGLPYLKDAIRCLLAQTSEDFTILALDDGSTDGSADYLAGLHDPRISISSSEVNLGLGATLQRGLDMCETPFFARMDADDLCHPERLSKQLNYLLAHPEVGMVGSQFHYFGGSGKKAPTPDLPLAASKIVEGLRMGRLSVIHGSIMARTATMKEAGGYRIRGMGEDWDMFLRFAEIGSIENLKEDLYGYRYHLGNTSIAHLETQVLGIEYACLCARRRELNQTEPEFAEFLRIWRTRPLAVRIIDKLDVYALLNYRTALSLLSEGRPIAGRLHLALGAALSPRRTFRRLLRSRA